MIPNIRSTYFSLGLLCIFCVTYLAALHIFSPSAITVPVETMPLLPIPSCVDSVFGKELKNGLVTICIIIILLGIIPILLLAVFCEIVYGGIPVAAVILAIIVILLLLLLEDVDPIVHFILIIFWFIVTVWIVFWALYMILHVGNFGNGLCGIVHLIAFVGFVLLAIVMVYGLIVYWSYYAQND